MKIELIPVIEIGYNNQGIKAPEEYPYWEYQEIWNKYRKESLEKAGFNDEFRPYLKGSPFYEPKEITDENLQKVVLDHTEALRNGEYDREQVSCLLGGLVLKINGEDKFYPQCCGDLSDVIYWQKLSKRQNSYYEGHPAPNYDFKDDTIIFDFSVDEYDEHFEPTPPEVKLVVNIADLEIAIENAKSELGELAERVKKINRNLNLELERIDDLLIWRNPNHD